MMCNFADIGGVIDTLISSIKPFAVEELYMIVLFLPGFVQSYLTANGIALLTANISDSIQNKSNSSSLLARIDLFFKDWDKFACSWDNCSV